VDPAAALLYTFAMLRRAGFTLSLLALSVACGLLVARLPPDLERTVVTRRHHNADPLLSAVLLRFDVDSLLRHPTRYFQPPFLYPDANPLRGTEPLIAEAVLAVPFRIVLGDRPAAVFTCVKITTLALVALFSGLMLSVLGVRPSLCLLGGGLCVLIGTMPVFVDRLQAVSIQWLPLAAIFAVRFWRRPRWLDAAAFAACVFLSIQASLYTAVMLVVPLPFVLPALWGQRAAGWHRPAGLALGLAAATGLSVAVLWPYLQNRADVAVYSASAYAAVKAWHPAALGDLATAAPEYAGWPLGPAADWGGVFPGTAFVLLLACGAALPAYERLRRAGTRSRSGAALDDAPTGDPHRAFRASGRLLAALLVGFAATLAWSLGVGPSVASRLVADALLWGSLAAWPLRLALWPPADDDERSRLGLLASTAALASLVLALVSLGTPITAQADGAPLLSGLFEPLSGVMPFVRELRELRRCLLPAGFLAVVAATLALERRLRSRPLPAAGLLAAVVLAVGLWERASADTRKGSVPPVPASYELLRHSSGTGGLLELPFDSWGRIESVYRMLWQPAHGRPIVAGRTGIEPGWYYPAQQVFDEFPSEESLRLARAWGIDTVLDTRPIAGSEWPEGVLLRAQLQAAAGRKSDATWRLFDLALMPTTRAVGPEPDPGPGVWERPSAIGADPLAGLACDGSTYTAAEVARPEGLTFTRAAAGELTAIELDFGHGQFNRVPKQLHVLGLDAAWRELGDGSSGRFLRARAAHQLLTSQAARLVVPLPPSRVSQVRLVAADLPWDLPEVRFRVSAVRQPPSRTLR
jgi:hypothetical protein